MGTGCSRVVVVVNAAVTTFWLIFGEAQSLGDYEMGVLYILSDVPYRGIPIKIDSYGTMENSCSVSKI